jgi:FeS assembly SUF system protein
MSLADVKRRVTSIMGGDGDGVREPSDDAGKARAGGAGPQPNQLPSEHPGVAVTEEMVIEVLSGIYDPEIPVNIYALGLVYAIDIRAGGLVRIRMTLTSPGCPSAQTIPLDVRRRVRALPGVKDVAVEVVWEPAWSPARMSDAARLELGLL